VYVLIWRNYDWKTEKKIDSRFFDKNLKPILVFWLTIKIKVKIWNVTPRGAYFSFTGEFFTQDQVGPHFLAVYLGRRALGRNVFKMEYPYLECAVKFVKEIICICPRAVNGAIWCGDTCLRGGWPLTPTHRFHSYSVEILRPPLRSNRLFLIIFN